MRVPPAARRGDTGGRGGAARFANAKALGDQFDARWHPPRGFDQNLTALTETSQAANANPLNRLWRKAVVRQNADVS